MSLQPRWTFGPSGDCSMLGATIHHLHRRPRVLRQFPTTPQWLASMPFGDTWNSLFGMPSYLTPLRCASEGKSRTPCTVLYLVVVLSWFASQDRVYKDAWRFHRSLATHFGKHLPQAVGGLGAVGTELRQLRAGIKDKGLLVEIGNDMSTPVVADAAVVSPDVPMPVRPDLLPGVHIRPPKLPQPGRLQKIQPRPGAPAAAGVVRPTLHGAAPPVARPGMPRPAVSRVVAVAPAPRPRAVAAAAPLASSGESSTQKHPDLSSIHPLAAIVNSPAAVDASACDKRDAFLPPRDLPGVEPAKHAADLAAHNAVDSAVAIRDSFCDDSQMKSMQRLQSTSAGIPRATSRMVSRTNGVNELVPVASLAPTTLPCLTPFIELVFSPSDAFLLAERDLCAVCGGSNYDGASMLACCDCGEAFHAQCVAGDLLQRLVSLAQAQCARALVSAGLENNAMMPDPSHPAVRQLVSIAISSLVSGGVYVLRFTCNMLNLRTHLLSLYAYQAGAAAGARSAKSAASASHGTNLLFSCVTDANPVLTCSAACHSSVLLQPATGFAGFA